MKKLKGIMIIILTAILMMSCENEEWNGKGNSKLNGFTIEYTISDPVSAITRATIENEQGEDKINSLYLLFFEYTSGGNGMFLEAIDAKTSSATILATSGKLDINFPEGSVLNGSTNYKVLFCANIEEYSTLSIQNVENIKSHFDGYTENEVIASLLKIEGVPTNLDPITEQEDNSNRMAISNLPMSASGVKTAQDATIEMELVRTVSRFDIFCQAPGYELVSASVWNALTVSPVWEGLHRDFSEDRTERYYGVGVNENKQIVGSLYAFENYVSKPTQNDKKTTCLIIGLKKDGSDKVEYFRANINDTNSGQQLKRNNVYRTTVTNVTGKGSENEREAYENHDLLIDIDINGWSLDDSGNFHHDGENVLAIPTHKINLSPYGEVRQYNIFTLGEGELKISQKELPSNIKAELKGNLLIVTAEPSKNPGEGKIDISFGVLSGHILINQTPHQEDFLDLNLYELPTFINGAGQKSSNIEVTSSGEWVAEIYKSDYFSFEDDNNAQKISIKGNSGESFNLYTIASNPQEDVRYCFVLVKLKDKPEVSRVIILAQAGIKDHYLTLHPDQFPVFSGGGGYTENITVHASGRFTATLSVNTTAGDAVFVDAIQDIEDEDESSENDKEEKDYGKTWTSKKNGNVFAIRISALTKVEVPAEIKLTVTLDDNKNITKEVIIKQNALSPNNLIVQTRKYAKAGALFNLNRANTNRYVYNLATNMRDASLFGRNGRVNVTEGYVFSSAVAVQDVTHIFQVTGSMTATQGRALKTWMDGNDRRFAFITHNAAYASTSVTRLNVNFGTNYAVIDPNIPAENPRYFVQNPDLNNKLISYLLNGPFGEVNPNNVQLKGKSIQNRGLTKWPDTFVPIIMGISNTTSTKGTEVCLFGIDPVMRIIWVTDPAIFGSKNANDAHSSNYPSGSDNERFLNNFIAWLTNAATLGDDFLKDFK